MLSNLPALAIVTSLMGAPLCTVIRKPALSWWLAMAVVTAVCGMCAYECFFVFTDSVHYYEMGGWPAPFGIEYRVDKLSAAMLLLVSFIGVVTLLYGKASVAFEIPEHKQPLFYTMFLLCLAGLMGIVITNDAFNIYVFLEISSLATYTLISMGKDRRALSSAFEYLILGSIGATFILIAIGLLYMMTGSLNIADIASVTARYRGSSLLQAALAFFTMGLALKIAIFPLHLWLTNAYTNAPSFVASFLSATATKVGIYTLIRVIFSLFGYEFVFETMPFASLFATFAMFAMVIGALVAVYQHNVKRLLAYSSVSQIGYIVLALSFASSTGVTAALIHIFAHALAKAAMFMAVGAMFMRVGGVRLADFRGFGREMPWSSVALILSGLSLIGVPFTAGFISKWFLLKTALEAGNWLVFVVIIANALLAICYVWKLVEVLFFDQPKKAREPVKKAPISMLFPMWVLVLMTIGFGVFAGPMIRYAQEIARYLMYTVF